MNVEELRKKALSYRTQRRLRYPIGMNPETRAELAHIDELAAAAAVDGAAAAAAQVSTPGEPTRRRSLGDPAPDVNALTKAAEAAIETLRANAQAILARAAESGELIVAVFGAPQGEDMNAHYLSTLAAHTDAEGEPDVEGLTSALCEHAYLRTESPDGTEVPLTWEELSTQVLDTVDLEVLRDQVFALYRGGVAIPFDPANFGAAPKS